MEMSVLVTYVPALSIAKYENPTPSLQLNVHCLCVAAGIEYCVGPKRQQVLWLSGKRSKFYHMLCIAAV